jgi:hypothetical protein
MRKQPLHFLALAAGALALTLGLGGFQQAAADDIAVNYLINAKGMKGMDPLGLLTFELHGNSSCSNLLHIEDVPTIDATIMIESLKPAKVKGAPKKPKMGRLNAVLDSSTLTPPL